MRARRRRTGDLEHDLLLFVGLLREVGVTVSPRASLHALRALSAVRLDRRADVRAALACCLISGPGERGVFDAVFEPYWERDPGGLPSLPDVPDRDEPAGESEGAGGAGELPPQQVRERDQVAVRRRSPAGRATYGRLAGRPRAERAVPRPDVDELARRLARALGTAPGRRRVPARHGDVIDLRASLRTNLRHGGELLELQRTAPRRDRPRLAVLCDVSSSMRPSMPLVLAFLHALTQRARRVESAVFNVDTVVVTEVFGRMDLRRSLRWLASRKVALSGGTRIGHCLHAFLDDLEPRRVLGPATVALVISDGWDVGEPALLRSGMRRLREQVDRIVWCDPHAAATGFRPQVQGLQIALPFVDDHLDFSGVAALAALVDRLASGPRPSRRPSGVPFREEHHVR